MTAAATQLYLTVTYSAPMRTTIACGSLGRPTEADGAIDDPSSAHYRTTDAALDEALRSSTQAAVTSDCTTVTFLFDVAAPSGSFTLTASQVEDGDGTAIDPARASTRMTIADEGRPRVTSVASIGQTIVVTFSEPMLRIGEGSGVTMVGNYRLDGSTAPATNVGCDDAGCRSVRMPLRAGTLVAGRTYELRIANVVDRAGRNITPDPTTLRFTAG